MIETQDQIKIALPIEKVMHLFRQQDLFKHWQKGLVDFKNLTGNPGSQGSSREMKIKMAGNIIKMREQIAKVDLPHCWEATYKLKGVTNFQKNHFESIRPQSDDDITNINAEQQKITLWKAQSTYKFSGMMRLVAKAKPELFKGQTKQHMVDFKTFAESYYSDIKTDKNERPKTDMGL